MNLNTELRRKLKYNAKRALTKGWGSAIAILFLFLSVEILFSIVSTMSAYVMGVNGVFDILNTPEIFLDDIPDISFIAVVFNTILMVGYIILTVPLKIGQDFWYYNLTAGTTMDVTSIFVCFASFRRFFRALALRLNIYIRKLFWILVLYALPTVALFCGAFVLNRDNSFSNQEALIGTTLIFCSVTLYGLFTIIACIIFQKYFLAPYYLYDDSISVRRAISLSIKASKGEKTIIFLYHFSFIGWYLLNVFIVPMLYTAPYIQTSRAMYARYLIYRYEYRNALEIPTSNIDSHASEK